MFDQEDHIKLIDFGLSTISERKNADLEMCGTPYYIAPEVLDEHYGSKCDMWSLGVLLYQLLTGDMPFDGESREEVFLKIRIGEFEIPKDLSENCLDLLDRMICVDQDLRISAEDALNHPWIKNK